MTNDELLQLFQRAGLGDSRDGSLQVRSPIDGAPLARLPELPAARDER